MLNKFLCALHREELNKNPEKARSACWKGFETGQNLKVFGYKREALAHFGCAFESAEIVMTCRGIDPIEAIGMFNATACAFIICLRELGYDQQCQAVLQMCADRLNQEALLYPEIRNTITTLITTLEQFSDVQYDASCFKDIQIEFDERNIHDIRKANITNLINAKTLH